MFKYFRAVTNRTPASSTVPHTNSSRPAAPQRVSRAPNINVKFSSVSERIAEEVVLNDVMKALSDYAATADDELTIKEDQLLYLLGYYDDYWAKVQVHGPLDALSGAEPAAGLVPFAYIVPAAPLYRAVALYDYEPNGEGEILMKEDEKLSVYLKEDEWILVKIDREGTVSQPAIGYVPASYVEDLPTILSQSKDLPGRPNLKKPKPTKTRIWHDRSGGFKVEAQFLGIHKNKIRLHKTNGVIIEVPEEKMSATDMEFIRKLKTNPTSLTSSLGSDDVPLDTLTNRGSPQGPPWSSRPPAPLQRQSHFDWFEFFLNSGCDLDDCTRYELSFEQEKLNEAILPDLKPDTLRGLGLREGDIIRVMKHIEQRDSKVQEQMKKDAQTPAAQPTAAPKLATEFDVLARLRSMRLSSAPAPPVSAPLPPAFSLPPVGFQQGMGMGSSPVPIGSLPQAQATGALSSLQAAGGPRALFAPVPQKEGLLKPLIPTNTGFNSFVPTRPGTAPATSLPTAGATPSSLTSQPTGLNHSFNQAPQPSFSPLLTNPQPTAARDLGLGRSGSNRSRSSAPSETSSATDSANSEKGWKAKNPSFATLAFGTQAQERQEREEAEAIEAKAQRHPANYTEEGEGDGEAPAQEVATHPNANFFTVPDTTPNSPATKLAPLLTTGSGKWVKFVTVVPGQHARFRIHDDTPPICGGFSDVWRCDARFSDGRVIAAAMKKFRAVRIPRDADACTVTNKLLKRLTKELGIWMALQHPRISPLLGFALEGDLCTISPWYTNGNVTEYIGRHPGVDRIKLVSDVASGIAYLHTRVPLVVHGDMKADNVLIDDAGNAVIIDFGLSAIVEDDPTLASSLSAASLQDAGNARWMAPELLMQEGCTRSPSTDVYSFGCVALQIYTGEIPFKDVPTFRIVHVLIKDQKPLARREDTQLSSPSLDWFYDLLVSCWDKNPMARPSMVDVESKLSGGVCSA